MATGTNDGHVNWAPPAELGGLRNIAFGVGAVALAASLAGYFIDSKMFLHSYATAFAFVMLFPLGGLALMMLNHVTRGAWGVVIRRILEASARTIPFMAVFVIPLVADAFGLFGEYKIFKWANPEVVAEDPIVASKVQYLNAEFFAIRAVIYFLVWTALAFVITKLSYQQDQTGDLALSERMKGWSAGGLVAFMVVTSFAAFDWLMSLDPHWFSSIYGVYYAGSAALAALALTVLVAVWLSHREPMNEVYRRGHYADWGKLMLAFTMLWGYFSISQLIILWSGNLPETVPWYLTRTAGMYKYFAYGLVAAGFFVPFVLLLSADLKRNPARLSLVAVYILLVRWFDIYWQTAPSFHAYDPAHATFAWTDFTLTIGLVGIWLGLFFTQLATQPLIPRNEPFLQEALSHHG